MVYRRKEETVQKRLKKLIERLKIKHNNQFEYELVNDYIDSQHSKIRCTCKKCGKTFEQTLIDHLKLKECKCDKDNKRINNFLEKAKKVHGNKYDYSETDYINSKIKIKIFCKKCKQFFWQSPFLHLGGCGCTHCNKNILLTQEEYIKRANLLHNYKFDYSKVNYINMRTPIEIICKDCKRSFFQMPGHHLKIKHCPHCFGTYHYSKEEVLNFTKQKEIEDLQRQECVNKCLSNNNSCFTKEDIEANIKDYI